CTGSFGETEVGAKIALGKITASARDLADLRQPASHNADARPHRVPIAFRSHEFEVQKMIPVASAIVQQQRRVSIICDHYICKAVIIEIGKSNAAADMGSLQAAAGQLGSFHEFTVALVVEQRVRLLVVNFRSGLLHLGIYMTIGDEQIQPPIVVIIKKSSPKTEHIVRGTGDAGLVTDLVEKFFAIVVPEVIGGSLEIRDVEIEPAVVVIIAEGYAHCRHGSPLGCKCHAARNPNLLESAVVLVEVEVGFDPVV